MSTKGKGPTPCRLPVSPVVPYLRNPPRKRAHSTSCQETPPHTCLPPRIPVCIYMFIASLNTLCTSLQKSILRPPSFRCWSLGLLAAKLTLLVHDAHNTPFLPFPPPPARCSRRFCLHVLRHKDAVGGAKAQLADNLWSASPSEFCWGLCCIWAPP